MQDREVGRMPDAYTRVLYSAEPGGYPRTSPQRTGIFTTTVD